MKGKFKYYLAAALLAVFAFNFAHSELGFMIPDGDIDHNNHDYCELINNIYTADHASAQILVKPEVNTLLSQAFPLPEFTFLTCSPVYALPHDPPGTYGNKETSLFVFYRSFLI